MSVSTTITVVGVKDTINALKKIDPQLQKAKKGVQLRIDTRRNAVGVILVEQKDPAAAIFETAGRANQTNLVTS
jgi:hypothetical protein